jgi:hypothetical protein
MNDSSTINCNVEGIETADLPFAINVSVPQHKSLKVTMSSLSMLEPVRNARRSHATVWQESMMSTKQHYLLTSLREAVSLLRRGAFKNSESGPYRIFSVYSL